MITAIIWQFLSVWLMQFWMWIVGGAVAVLAFLFSQHVRKYTLAIIAIVLILAITYLYGYNSNDTVTPPACEQFRQVLVKGTATDKAINIFRKHDLCS